MLLPDAVVELGYAKDWSKDSARWYASRLKLFLAWCDAQGVTTIEEVTPPLVRRYIDHLQHRTTKQGQLLDSHTVNGHVRIIRTLLFWAVAEELIDANLPKRIKPPKKEQKVLHILSDTQLGLMFKAAAQTDTPLRDTALLSLLLDTGCRANELCGLRLEDVHFAADGAWLLVHGKGRKQRPIALGKRSRLALSRYLHRERLGVAVLGAILKQVVDRMPF